MQNNTYMYAAGIALITILINVALAYSGQTQKLSCTLEQSAAVAAAVQTATSTK